MNREQLSAWLYAHFAVHEGNVITKEQAIRPELAGLCIYDEPLIGVGMAADPLFSAFKRDGVIGPWYMGPDEWLPGAQAVVSLFFPFTDEVRKSNAGDPGETSAEWLHGRIEGQAFLSGMLSDLCRWLRGQGVGVCAPSIDPRFASIGNGKSSLNDPRIPAGAFGSNWSERHAAFVCGLGTFGLSRGLITKKGIAGRFGSVIVDCALEPDVRPYTDIYEYCTRCGACVSRCPVHAISLEEGKKHLPCSNYLDETMQRYAPRYGCGKCQTAVPCQSGIPGR